LGHEVYFISGVGADNRGDRIIEEMTRRGLSTRYISRTAEQATGSVTVQLSSDGQPRFTIHRPAAYDCPELADEQMAELSRPVPDWIYFGTLLQTSSQAKCLTNR